MNFLQTKGSLFYKYKRKKEIFKILPFKKVKLPANYESNGFTADVGN